VQQHLDLTKAINSGCLRLLAGPVVADTHEEAAKKLAAPVAPAKPKKSGGES
jgi:hypothetical protein